MGSEMCIRDRFATGATVIDRVDADLTMRGLCEIYGRNKEARA